MSCIHIIYTASDSIVLNVLYRSYIFFFFFKKVRKISARIPDRIRGNDTHIFSFSEVNNKSNNNSQGVVPKTRNLSSGDTSGVKPLGRTRFSIYGDDSSKRNDDATGKFLYHRATEPNSSKQSVRFDQSKSTCLRENFRSNTVAPIQRNRESNGSSRGSSSSSRVSPTDLPHITRPNVSKVCISLKF